MICKHYKTIAALPLLASLAACSTTDTHSCVAGQYPAVQHVLYFGAARRSGVITSDEWAKFLKEVVTPGFPQGLTVWQASGQWQSASGDIIEEPTYVLTLIQPAGSANESSIQEIAAEYKVQFEQEAVLQVRSDVCMAL